MVYALWYNAFMTIAPNIIEMVEMEVRLYYVSASWVAWYYGVPLSNVYAAVNSGRLRAVKVPAAERMTLLFDRRTLPNQWPSRRNKAHRAMAKKRRAQERRERMEAAA
jgi:hypothetical protein